VEYVLNIMSLFKHLQSDIKAIADPKKILILQRFFKTGPGEYGEGDIFIGIKVPDLRKLALRAKEGRSPRRVVRDS
jgi:hypothetical protein